MFPNYYRWLFSFCIVFLFGCKEKSEPLPKKPNIIFILVDDLGLMDLGITGSSFYETPNIDNLAKEGMIFTQGYAASSVCSPSRASIMTGKFTARHGITDWIGAKSGKDWRKLKRNDKLLPAKYLHQLQHDEITLAEALKKEGYKTFLAGKWHLGGEGSLPEDHGFDINIGGWDKGSPIGGYFSPWKNPKLKNIKKGENLSQRLAKETSSFIKKYKDSSFFAFLSFYAVHGPIQTTEERWTKYREKASEMGIADKAYEMERVLPIRKVQDNPIYAGLVAEMDDAVGMVLETIKTQGLENNTIVVFTSDNGGVASGDSFSTSNLPLRGGKGYQWEGGIREPYFIKVPWLENKGESTDYPVTGADFYPTLLDLAGCDLVPEQHLDGISLKPILEGNDIKLERPLFWHYPHYGNQGGNPSSIIREGNWKLIHYWEGDSQELYNLSKDLSEQNNVIEQHPEVAKKLSTKLLNWLKDVGAQYPLKDETYNVGLATEKYKSMVNEKMPSLEKQRIEFLSPDFKPNIDWWGSKLTKD